MHRTFESVIESDRGLSDIAVSEKACYHEQLEVKGESLDGKEGNGLFEHPTAKKLEPGLRVANAQIEQDANQQLVHEALQAPEGGVRHPRSWVTLRANDSITCGVCHHFDESSDVRGIQFHVGINEGD